MKWYILGILLLSSFFSTNCTRSVLRNSYKKLPQIVTYWKNNPRTKYSLRDTHLQLYPLFKSFDYSYFQEHQIPKNAIMYKNNSAKKVTGKILCQQIDTLIKELKAGKKEYTHFKKLKSNDFNNHMLSGVIILKCKDYPFVVKVFMENPQTFVLPFSKGWQPGCLYVMSGGINRFLAGFNRIKNLEIVNKNIQKDTYWSTKLTTPRKWYYLPSNTQWFTLEGYNIGPTKHKSISLPSAYVIIADAIEKEKTLSLYKKEDRALGLKLSKFLGNRVDPHIDNFVIEKRTKKIALIDTEHFPSIIGLTKEIKFNTYPCWYSQLCKKFIQDKWSRAKPYRKLLQKQPQQAILPC